ncbi:MAG: hypothetical protein EOM59_09945 [Clostridia bacterium]|nr:hypothetical protein [Clostridia bacterium]
MKTRLLTLLLCLLVGFLTGCSTPRKLIASKEEKTKVDQSTKETNTGTSSTFVDTTKTDGVEITYTKIEYYPPETNREPTPEPEGQVTPGKTNRPEGNRSKEPTPAKKQPPNKGPIKSIEQLTIKQNSEEKGVSQSQEANATAKEEITTTDIDKKEANTEQPAADPYRWRYILAILVIVIVAGTVVYFWLRKTKVGITVTSFIKKIFCS